MDLRLSVNVNMVFLHEEASLTKYRSNQIQNSNLGDFCAGNEEKSRHAVFWKIKQKIKSRKMVEKVKNIVDIMIELY